MILSGIFCRQSVLSNRCVCSVEPYLDQIASNRALPFKNFLLQRNSSFLLSFPLQVQENRQQKNALTKVDKNAQCYVSASAIICEVAFWRLTCSYCFHLLQAQTKPDCEILGPWPSAAQWHRADNSVPMSHLQYVATAALGLTGINMALTIYCHAHGHNDGMNW